MSSEESEIKINPSHYQFPNEVQVIDITENLCFCLGNVVKYSSRAGRKDGEDYLDDLRKASWYLARAIQSAEERIKKEARTA